MALGRNCGRSFRQRGLTWANGGQGRPGPEAATVALDVQPYSGIQRRALLAHRTQIPPTSMWARLPDELYRRAFATAYFMRLYPVVTAGEREPELCSGLPDGPYPLQSSA